MSLQQRLQHIKIELRALAAALQHPRTPWYARAVILLVVAYAVSPIDLIPDPIPLLGLLDDALLLPLGILLARRLIPAEVMKECRALPLTPARQSVVVLGASLVIATWAGTVVLLWRWLG